MRPLPALSVLLASCSADTGLDEYLQHKAAFLERQRRMRSDEDERRPSETERAANAALSSMRNTLRANMSGVVAAQPLRSVKDVVRSTELFSMLHDMPKGAQLHVHSDTMVALDVLLQNVTHRPHCYVYWNAPEGGGLPWFAKSGIPRGTVRFFRSDSDAPAGYEAAASLRARIKGFDSQLLAHWDVLRGQVAYNETTDIWGPFQRFFSMVDGGYLYRPVFEDYLNLAFLNVADNWKTDYVEIRCLGYQTTLYDLERTYTMAETIAIFQGAVAAVKAVRPSFEGAGLIYSQYRHVGVDTIWKSLEDAYQMQQQFPGFVVGWDLVGKEDAGRSLSEFIEPLVAYTGKVDYFFHAGETDESGSNSTAMNINDALLLGSKRIGHGLAMAKLPLAAEYAVAQDIAVEINLISNQGLQYVLDARNHPGATLLAQGVQLVICNDDPAILGTTDSVAYDWFVMYMSWDVDIWSLRHFARNSIRYSAASPETKARLERTFNGKWDSWVSRVATLAA